MSAGVVRPQLWSSYARVFPHPVPGFSLSYELKNLFGSKTSFLLSMK